MAFQRLSVRVGLPVVLLVLLETVALAAYLSLQIASEEQDRFAQTAARNAQFIERASLPPTADLAEDLKQLIDYAVYFREGSHLRDLELPPAMQARVLAVPADGRPRRDGAYELVAVPMYGKGDLVLVRTPRLALLDQRVLQGLLAFVLLAILAAWIVVRGLVRPLRHLANQLPRIEQPGEIVLPEAARRDEIGDLARAFVRTRDALHAERETRQRVEKLAVLGRMTAALAHEVQNPVAAIRMHAQLLRGAGVDDTAAIIEQETTRIENLLNQWLFLTRPEPPAIRTLDLAPLLHEVAAAHRARATHAAVTITVTAPPTLPVAADGKRLQHVFRNLIDNAIQAMPSGGALAITARADGERVVLTFADRGRGFSPQALQRFAEFFFSEKEGGMGIGLSVADEILKAHGGSLRVANRDGGGAEVTVELPGLAAGATLPTS